MPVIYDYQLNQFYNPPKFGTGLRGFIGKPPSYGGAWRDFNSNVVIGDSLNKKMKQEFEATVKQQKALDEIIKNTTTKLPTNFRSKLDIIGDGFKMC